MQLEISESHAIPQSQQISQAVANTVRKTSAEVTAFI